MPGWARLGPLGPADMSARVSRHSTADLRRSRPWRFFMMDLPQGIRRQDLRWNCALSCTLASFRVGFGLRGFPRLLMEPNWVPRSATNPFGFGNLHILRDRP